MADGINIEVKGLAELQVKLDDLGTKAADRAIRKALRAGATIEHAAIVERAPTKQGSGGILPLNAMRNDIAIRMSKDDAGANSAIVGPGKLTAHVARWVEYGHRLVVGGYSKLLANGKTRGPGSQVGDVPAHPFIRPAYEASRTEVVDAICKTLAVEVEAAGKRKGAA